MDKIEPEDKPDFSAKMGQAQINDVKLPDLTGRVKHVEDKPAIEPCPSPEKYKAQVREFLGDNRTIIIEGLFNSYYNEIKDWNESIKNKGV
jgi:hypothetical protein